MSKLYRVHGVIIYAILFSIFISIFAYTSCVPAAPSNSSPPPVTTPSSSAPVIPSSPQASAVTVKNADAQQQAQEQVIKGDSFLAQKQWDKAIAAYSVAINLDPKLAKAYCNRGNAYSHMANIGKEQGDWDRAIADFTAAIELDPKYAEAYELRGFCYYSIGEEDKSMADVRKVMELRSK